MSINAKSFNEIVEKINQTNIKHVSFDFWDTLYTSNSIFKEKRSKLLEDFGLKNSSEIQEIITEISRVHNLNFKSNKKCLNANELNTHLLHQIGIKNNFSDIVNQLYKLFNSTPPLLSIKALALLEYLSRKKITFSILSNTAYIPGIEIRKVLKKDKILQYFSFCNFSDEIRYGKPSKIAFRTMVQEIRKIHPNITLHQIIHIGDSFEYDVKPADDFGIQSLIV